MMISTGLSNQCGLDPSNCRRQTAVYSGRSGNANFYRVSDLSFLRTSFAFSEKGVLGNCFT